jgi:hypothetical protein
MTLLTLVRLRTAKGTNSDSHGEYGKGTPIGGPGNRGVWTKGDYAPSQYSE